MAFTTNFNNEDGEVQNPTPAEVDEIEGLELVEITIETEENTNN